jgi:hypothetical protein
MSKGMKKLDRVFNSRSGRMLTVEWHCSDSKLPNLQLKTRAKQLLGSLPLDFALPGLNIFINLGVYLLAFCKLDPFIKRSLSSCHETI